MRGRDFDEQVLPVHLFPQLLGRVNRAVGVAGEARLHLDGDTSVYPTGGLIHRRQHITTLLNVRGGQFEYGLVNGSAIVLEVADLFGITVSIGKGLGEDRRVRGDSDNVLVYTSDAADDLTRVDLGGR